MHSLDAARINFSLHAGKRKLAFQRVVRWCNGSTRPFGGLCPGSNPGRTAMPLPPRKPSSFEPRNCVDRAVERGFIHRPAFHFCNMAFDSSLRFKFREISGLACILTTLGSEPGQRGATQVADYQYVTTSFSG